MTGDLLKKGGPIPVAPGRVADLLHDIRELRLEMQRQTEAMQERETELQEHLIALFDTSTGDTGATGERYRAELQIDRKAKLQDWGVFTSYVRKNDLFHLLQKRIADKAVAEQMESEARLLPGLEIIRHKWVSITKRN